VPVEIDPPVDATDFLLSVERRRQLFKNGLGDFHSYYAKRLKPLEQAKDVIQKLQALYASPDLVEPLLEVVCSSIEAATNAVRVRSHVMLPTVRETRVVAYQFGMDGMPDRTLELDLHGGCSGHAFKFRKEVYADLAESRTNFAEWGMTREQQDRIPSDLKAMISIPLLDTSEITPDKENVQTADLPVIGTLSIDTVTDGREAGWVDVSAGNEVLIKGPILDFLGQWADIITKVLT
jgi:hypothetical protein